MWCSCRRLFLALVIYGLALFPGTPLLAAQEPLIFAIHPYLSVPEIQKRFMPLANYLAAVLQRPVSIRVGGNYEEHIHAIGRDEVDMAFMGPAAYISMVEQFGSKPVLARFEVNNDPNLYGVIATRRDTRIMNLSILAHKRFAFGDPGSTMSHIVPRYMLLQAGLENGAPVDYKFLGSHQNVALGILAGDFDAGAMKKEVFDQFESRGLRALAITPGVPDHLFVARSNLPPEDISRLRDALLGLKDAAILQGMHKGLTALVPAGEVDYQQLRSMLHAVNALDQ